MRRPLRRGAWPAITALTALIATGAVPPAGASPAGPISVSTLKPSAAAATAHTVRLITGDRVVVTGSGEERQVSFVPDSDSPTGVASIVRHGDDIRVLPEEVRSLLGSGVLDSRLFEVGALIEQGYADGRDLPLIVQNTDTDAAVPEQSEQVGRLPTIRSTATRVRTEKTQKFWAGLRDTADGATAKKLADGVSRIWLDGKVTPMLDKSVPQIGAPAAWAAGYDGKGTKVAVLDTGIDATHADLADRIEEARNFSSSADAVDRHGHGTHVASTVAGSGDASGGRYKGVAPGAKLLIGKVLGDNGSGSDSSVLAGMEWAAHSGARVVSMSLGSSAPTNGTDPLSLAVNRLTAETGALFVIAAGNNGPDPVTISSPGSADAALTVAAVDGQDTIASFSSRGPRSGGVALKPDIAGPGVGIVAARGAGTAMGTPVDANYTAASGTSMATPHVAGAATILAQRHPDWSAADLKGVLTSSAKVLPDGAFAEGSGRVDVARAINTSVWATNASVGRFAQGATAQPVTRTVTFHKRVRTALTPRVADAGAGAIMLVSDTGFPAIAGVQLPVPAFGVSKPEGDRIAAAVAVAPVSVKLTGETTTSYTYQIVDGHKDAFPADLSLAPAQSRFADVLSKDYSPAPADAGNLYSQAGWMGQSTITGNGASNYDFFTLGTTQHAYLLAADTKWSRLALASGYLSAPLVGGTARTYTPGSRSTQDWFKPVLHAATSSADIIPGANSQPYRTGDSMIIMIPQYATGASDIVEYGGGGAQGDKSAFRLYQGDTLLGTAPQAWVEVDNLPREKAPYRIELDSGRNNRWWSVSTEQHSAWTFPSAHVEGEGEGRAQLPLIQADYDLEGVTLDSSVGAGRAHDLKVSFRGPDGARTVLTKARVDVSYDEGDTWRTVSSRAHKGAVSGVVKAPRGAKGISLRIHGENAAGSTIDQTVIHAVHVR